MTQLGEELRASLPNIEFAGTETATWWYLIFIYILFISFNIFANLNFMFKFLQFYYFLKARSTIFLSF